MISEKELKDIISQVLKEMDGEGKALERVKERVENTLSNLEEVEDITKIDLREVIDVLNPKNREELLKYKRKTPARVGIGRAGTRYTTSTMLRFRADHASAQDAVFTDVSDEVLAKNNLFTVQTRCNSKDEYITRPDLGRRLSDEAVKILKERCKQNPTVQVYVSDGLSSTAVEANVENILPALLNGLKAYGIDTGTPFS